MLLEDEGGWRVGGEATQPEHRPRRTLMPIWVVRGGGTQTVSLATRQRMNRMSTRREAGVGAVLVQLGPFVIKH